MPTVRAFIRKSPVALFFALTFAISWGGVLLTIGGPGGIPGTQEDFDRLLPRAIAAMLAGPSVAGILLIALLGGTRGLRELVARLGRWRVGARWFALALMPAPIVFATVQFALSLASPIFLPGLLTTGDRISFVVSGVSAALIVGLLEELGWTGFAVPALRPRLGILVTGLTVGMVWGGWHVLTNDLWASGSSLGAGQLSLPAFAIARGVALVVGGLPAYRVLMVWVYDRTESLPLAILMHANYAACTFILGPLAISGTALLVYDLVSALAWWGFVATIAVVDGRRVTRPAWPRRAA